VDQRSRGNPRIRDFLSLEVLLDVLVLPLEVCNVRLVRRMPELHWLNP
jgi:hypothetical protein